MPYCSLKSLQNCQIENEATRGYRISKRIWEANIAIIKAYNNQGQTNRCYPDRISRFFFNESFQEKLTPPSLVFLPWRMLPKETWWWWWWWWCRRWCWWLRWWWWMWWWRWWMWWWSSLRTLPRETWEVRTCYSTCLWCKFWNMELTSLKQEMRRNCSNQILEIHIAQCWLLVLGPIETYVRKCISPKYVSFPFNCALCELCELCVLCMWVIVIKGASVKRVKS